MITKPILNEIELFFFFDSRDYMFKFEIRFRNM